MTNQIAVTDSELIEDAVQAQTEARAACDRLIDLLTELVDTVAQESRHVRNGHYDAAADIAPRKGELASAYMSDMTKFRDNIEQLEGLDPERIGDVRNTHDKLKAELQINLAVLATARQVSENLIKSAAEAAGVEAGSGQYGRGGSVSQPSDHAKGIALNSEI